ncbi:MAG: hypothetical protein N2111_06765 [Candidatus Sumerlaeaceae bacterium]|nr:hypothetical protein [Candidatus Sumerlaeaceae bacterium]
MKRPRLTLDAQSTVWTVAPHAHLPLGQAVPVENATSWDWMDAQVPADILTILKRHGLAPDPMVGFNDESVRWVELVDWGFRAQFVVPPEFLDAEAGIHLVLRDLDCHAEIFLNRTRVGVCGNQFREYRFLVEEDLIEGPNELIIYLRSSKLINESLERAHGRLPAGFDSTRVFSRRCQCATGWDWTARISSVGVLSLPKLEHVPFFALEAPFAFTRDLSFAEPGAATCSWASLVVQCDIVSYRRGKGIVSAEVLAPDGKVVAREQSLVTIGKGRATHRMSFRVKEPRLWWPLHMGPRELYTVRFVLEGEDRVGAPASAAAEANFGIRTVGLLRQRDSEGETFTPVVNGVPVFCRGANWVPVSMLPGEITTADYARLIGAAAAAGMNCLRVWGGGIYERDEFYDLCDRLGILVWQDFMFACAAYPTYREFLEEVEFEAEHQVTRLRNHPSLLLWCGNNENEWLHQTGWLRLGNERKIIGEQIWSSLLRDIVEEFDPSRPYHQSSPSGRNRNDWNDMTSGDRHNWECWAFWEPPDAYLRDTGRFLSEFGFQSVPSPQSLARFAPGADSIDSAELAHHQRMPGGTARLARYLFDSCRIPDSLAAWAETTQRLQADILATAAEHWRRRKFSTSGALIWQFNDAYPAISWSLIDFYGLPKAAYFESRRFFAPVMVSISLVENGQSVFAFVPEAPVRAALPPEGMRLNGGEWPLVLLQGSAARAVSVVVVNDLLIPITGTLRVLVRPAADQPAQEVTSRVVNLGANSRSDEIAVSLNDLPALDMRGAVVTARLEPDSASQQVLNDLNASLKALLEDFESRWQVPESLRPSAWVQTDAGLECVRYLVAPKFRPKS